MKNITKKRLTKSQKEKKVLFSLVELYIESHQPIGSKTLMESSFKELSSATIRNYFASLEQAGYLSQQHTSGGRIPTEKAYKAYAEEFLKLGILDAHKDKKLLELSYFEDNKVASYLHKAAELLSEVSHLPTFISSPRFDHDFVTDLKVVPINSYSCLCVVITELGQVHTEVLHFEQKLHHHALKRVESVLISKLSNQEPSHQLDHSEELLAQKIYNEVMVRYIIGYANYSLADIYSTGLSRLLSYPEFNNAESFASGLALFENKNKLRDLLDSSCVDKTLKVYIGSELRLFSPVTKECSALILPYTTGGKIVGAVGILGPTRLSYRDLFGTLRAFVEYVSKALTQCLVKHKLTYRSPGYGKIYLDSERAKPTQLLEDQS